MDIEPDFEVPSPKRVRLEAQKLAKPPSDGPAKIMNEDSGSGTEPAAIASSSEASPDFHVIAQPKPSTVDSKPFHLPGLSPFSEDPKSTNELSSDDQASRSGLLEDSNTRADEQGDFSTDGGLSSSQKVEGQKAGEHSTLEEVPLPLIEIDVPKALSPSAGTVNTEDKESQQQKNATDAGISMGEAPLDARLQQTTLESPKIAEDGLDAVTHDESDESVGMETTQTELGNSCEQEESLQSTIGKSDGDFKVVSTDVSTGAGAVTTDGVEVEIEDQATGELVEANFPNGDAEFEMDWSPLGSSSSSETSIDTSSSDDSDTEDYKMLDPEEEARRLMAEDGGSDDEGGGKGGKSTAHVPRTQNEKPDEIVPKPNIIVTEEMKIEELGPVENSVENLILIKAKTSGEYQVLETGSLLCLEDRSVIGVVAETLGRVQQPYYSVRFTNEVAIKEAGITRGTVVFYVVQYSTTVFTQPLKSFKGSDASNLHDEEVGDDELEFSDDEAEAEYRKQAKLQKRAKQNDRDAQKNGFSRGSHSRPGQPPNRSDRAPKPGGQIESANANLNYDDADVDVDDDGLYTPLARPSNLHEMITGNHTPKGNHANDGMRRKHGRNLATYSAEGNRGDRGRRGRGQRGGRGPDRGEKSQRIGRNNRDTQSQSHPHLEGSQGSYGHSPDLKNIPSLHPPNIHTPPFNSFQPPHPPSQPLIPTAPYASQSPSQHQSPYIQPYQHPYQPNPYAPYPSQASPPIYSNHNFSQQHQYPANLTPHAIASTANIPPGAHINPNFFRQQAQASQHSWQHQALPPQQNHYPQMPAGGNTNLPGQVSPEAFLQGLEQGKR